MIPHSNKHSTGEEKRIATLINASLMANQKDGKSKGKDNLTAAQEAIIKKLDEKTKSLFDIMGDEDAEFQGTW